MNENCHLPSVNLQVDLFDTQCPTLLGQVPVILLNCTAPALVGVNPLHAAMHMSQYVLSNSIKGIGLVLTPVFSYTKNGVWKEESTIMQYLANTGAHCDRQWFLTFKEKCAQG